MPWSIHRSDAPASRPGPRRLVVLVVRNITDHHTMLVAAGVAFYSMLALIPALIAVVAVYGLVADPSDVEPQLQRLTEALPRDAANLLISQLESVTSAEPVGITLGLAASLVAVLWAISNAMNALVMAIRIAHERPSPHNWFQGRVFALWLSLVAVVVVAATLWLVVALPQVLGSADVATRIRQAIEIGRWPLAVLVSGLAQILLYRTVLGRREGTWHSITLGVVSSTLIWVGGSVGLSVFVNNVGRVESTFGTLGAVAVLMVWLYVSAFAVLFGAEIDGAVAHHLPRTRVVTHLEDHKYVA